MHPGTRPIRTVRFGTDPDEVYDVWEPPRAGTAGAGTAGAGTVALVHGGLWHAAYDRHQLDPAAGVLARAGLHVANVEYTRVGMPGGGWPGTGASLRSGLQAVVDDASLPDPVVAVGHSAGAQLVIWAASQDRVPGLAAAVSLAGVLDLHSARTGLLADSVRGLLGADADAAGWADADPSRQRLAVPAVIMHGADDDLVPPEQSRRYVATRRAGEPPCRMVLLDGCGHFGFLDPGSAAFTAVRAVIWELLGLDA